MVKKAKVELEPFSTLQNKHFHHWLTTDKSEGKQHTCVMFVYTLQAVLMARLVA